jgi:hypothetical protein
MRGGVPFHSIVGIPRNMIAEGIMVRRVGIGIYLTFCLLLERL